MLRERIEQLIQAKGKRKAYGFAEGGAFRIVDGAADGIPGLVVDEYAGRWLAQSPDAGDPGWEAALLAANPASWWKQLDRADKGSPRALGDLAACMPDPFLIDEGGLKYEISFRSGYSHGLFLDQRNNRARVRQSLGAGQTMLNLFAYTCGFSVVAAAAGATTSSVDLSGSALAWGKRNFVRNGFDPSAHHFPKGDAHEWLCQFARKGRRFDGIVLDPPTFSRNKGVVWRVEENFHQLVRAAVAVLAPGGWLLCSTNCRRLPQWKFDEDIHIGFHDAGRDCVIDWGGMPADFPGDPYLLNAWCVALD